MEEMAHGGLLASVFSAFAELSRSSLPPTTAAYDALLAACAACSDVASMLQVINRMLATGLTPSLASLRLLVNAMLRTGRVQAAWAVFSRLQQTAAFSVSELLPVIGLLMEGSHHDNTPAFSFSADVSALLARLNSELSRLSALRQPSARDLLDAFHIRQEVMRVAGLRREPEIVSRHWRLISQYAQQEGLKKQLDAWRLAVLSFCRAGDWHEAMAVMRDYSDGMRRWTEARTAAAGAQQQSSDQLNGESASRPRQLLDFRLSVQAMLLLSRALYLQWVSREQLQAASSSSAALAKHSARISDVMSVLQSSRVSPDDRTLLCLLCAALPSGDSTHLSLVANVKQNISVPRPVLLSSRLDLQAERVAYQQQVETVLTLLELHSLHPSPSLLSLLLSSLSFRISSQRELQAVLSVLHRLRTVRGVHPSAQASYPTLHSILRCIDSSRPKLVKRLLDVFQSDFAISPTADTVHILAAFAARRAATPAQTAERRSVRLQHLLVIDKVVESHRLLSALPAATYLLLLRAWTDVGGQTAFYAACRYRDELMSRRQREAGGVDGLDGELLAALVRGLMAAGRLGVVNVTHWWFQLLTQEEQQAQLERSQEASRSQAAGLPLMRPRADSALQDAVVLAVLQAVHGAGDEEATLSIIRCIVSKASWNAAQLQKARKAARSRAPVQLQPQPEGEEELLDAL